ncbi:helix-turn-helix transcriptional regulator [Vallitalea sp.]|uniref:helix-turn-helix transcriptional regulator n=1 Tax=Vallitalea sp. TaxID=1882829 RepID=UPI0025E0D93E|nr:helix-turn-helix transcriptional regulator [Vallitalea sp.]MCT4688740.1 AAA family ATPase [Vallitalea sp.]
MFRLNNIYGRKYEIEMLNKAYREVCNGEFKFILIKGNSGTGKTALVLNALKPAIQENIFFISGKFDQFNDDEPYRAFTQAFKYLIKKILTQPKNIVDNWHKKLKDILGRNGTIIARFIREIELIIGKQQFNEEYIPQKAKRRFENVFKKFLQAFPTEDHPMILFIDDLQWADSSSLEMLRSICESSDSKYLMIIGAYRQEEVGGNHQLQTILDKIDSNNSKIEYITLDNITPYDINNMIKENLQCNNKDTTVLANIIFKKTLGNPFFINQFVNYIIDEHYLWYNHKEEIWSYNLDILRGIEVDDNVVALVLKRISKLNNTKLLKLISCLGCSFDLASIMVVSNQSIDKIKLILNLYIDSGLIIIQNKEYKTDSDNENNITYEFLHDKIQQAVYTLIPNFEKKQIHYNIGCSFLNNFNENEIKEKILSIMHHINYSIELIEDKMRISIAKYNLMAGKKAVMTAAFDSALKYFKNGKNLFGEDNWKENHELIFQLNLEYAKSEFLCGNKEESERVFELLENNARTKNNYANIYSAKTSLFSYEGDYNLAIKTGIKSLEYLGYKIPDSPKKINIILDTLVSLWYFRNSRSKKILNMKPNSSKKIDVILEQLTLLAPAANLVNADLFVIISLRIAILSIKHGNSKYSSIGYIGYGIIAGSVLGNYKKANLLKETASILSEKYNDGSALCIYNFIDAVFINHWREHARNNIKYFQDAIKYGIESGEYIYAAFSASIQVEFEYYIGVNIDEICNKCLHASELTNQLQMKATAEYLIKFREAAKSVKTGDLEFFYNKDIERFMKLDSNDLIMYFLIKIQAFYLYEVYDETLQLIEMSLKLIEVITGFIHYAEHIFYHSLIILGMYNQLTGSKKRKYLRMLRNNLSILRKYSNNCKENYLHKYYLIYAEICGIKKNHEKASLYYDLAIKSSAENEYIQNEAIANELAGKYYHNRGNNNIATYYFKEAYDRYSKWGAIGKCEKLNRQYKELMEEMPIHNYNPMKTLRNPIDKYKIITKAYKEISEEKDRNKQYNKILETAISITNAQRGYLFVEKEEEMFTKYYKENDMQDIAPVDNVPLEENNQIPKMIIRYMGRTKETIIINNNISTSIFSTDNYIIDNEPYAILGIPIIVSSIFLCAIYLENVNNKICFAQEDITSIKMLSHSIQLPIKKKKSTVSIKSNNKLSKREQEVIKLMVQGLSNKEIAESLNLTINTVKTHAKNIYTKLGVDRRIQAVSLAKELGY